VLGHLLLNQRHDIGYEYLIDSIELLDKDDRHVLAAAIHCRAGLIVTLNLGDFPAQALNKFSIEAQYTDNFVLALFESFPDLVADAATTHRISLKNPAKTPDEYLANWDEQGLIKTVVTLRELTTH
jgi:hypothetical protein